MSDINSLIQKILSSLGKKGFSLCKYEDKVISYKIKEEKLKLFLKIIFRLCSKNSFCFSIFREEYDKIEVVLYSKSEDRKIDIFLENIEEKTILEYRKKVLKYKKYKIFPIIGPDGVGKTTLFTNTFDKNEKNLMYKRFKKIVRRSVIYNIVYPINKFLLKKKLGKKPEKDQHDDIHYLLVILAGLFYYPYLLFSSIIRDKTVFVDRFFNDYLLENISFLNKKTRLRKRWKNLLKYIPTVYWTIHLDAKPKIILQRKEELKKRDIKKYRKSNFKIYLEKPSIVYSYINTGLDLEYCQEILLKNAQKIGVTLSDKFICKINDDLLIAKGGERACYIHPEDNTKVIKILYTQGIHNNQNRLEYIYMNYLKKKEKNLSHLTNCYGFIKTDKGEGLVFDRVLNYDKTPAKSFRYMVANKILSLEEQKILINELKEYLEKNQILFVDTSLTNIFCPEIKKGKYKLIIVDGIGAKRMGIKFWFYQKSKIYTKYKIKRQWAKFMQMYKKDVKRAALGQRPFTRL
ncbi:YrbL family protein [Halarcobacter anaerophilus]|uniref:YrbL family protein n=1 Tax=Halarcobacter anaerophilus TaxID=877500 RepID=UPI0006982E0E|nr:YrbL family protein [Halarcobacter anaerophilus]